jgi:nucleoside-diphosphate-sugar epimerase
MSRVAVTGASGFVGRHLVRAAAAAGHEVTGLVRSERAAALVRESGGRAEPLGDDPASLAERLAGMHAVVHLAQIGAERDGQSYDAVNVGLTARVVEAARGAGVLMISSEVEELIARGIYDVFGHRQPAQVIIGIFDLVEFFHARMIGALKDLLGGEGEFCFQ